MTRSRESIIYELGRAVGYLDEYLDQIQDSAVEIARQVDIAYLESLMSEDSGQ